MKLKIVFLTLIFASLLSCKKQKTAIEFEQEVFKSVFSDLADSVYVNTKIAIFPPPPINGDSLKYNLSIKECKNSIIEVLNEDQEKKIFILNRFFSIDRKVLDKDDYNEFSKIEFKSNNLINIHSIKIKNFKTYLLSDSLLQRRLVTMHPSNDYCLNVSRILLNDKSDRGLLFCVSKLFLGNSQIFKIKIKLINNEWLIEKIQLFDISNLHSK